MKIKQPIFKFWADFFKKLTLLYAFFKNFVKILRISILLN